MKYPHIGFDGRQTALVLGPKEYIVAGPEYPAALALTKAASAAFKPLSDYPVLRWIELYTAENSCIIASQSVKKVLAALAADPQYQYTLANFTKENIMATAKKTAAATEGAATDAKAKNAAKAPAAKKAPATKAAAEKAPATKAAKQPAAEKTPAKQPAKAAKAAKAPAAEGAARKGRPSGLDEAAKIKKGSVDFKEHVRAETVRYDLMAAIVGGVGKTIGEVLGTVIDDTHTVKSVDVRFALENQYIAV